ncbi:MAG: RluA family pseudouridine synthase [Thiobacillus sp.]|nr:RluA family pseudouridine synthase [Thiobacillus sp.]
MSFKLIHADAHILVLNKPSGLLSVPGRGPDKQDCLSARVQAEYPDALIVHRLDMDTSGLLIMARGPEMQRQLSMAFAARRVHKRYIAVVAGSLAAPATPDGWGLIDLPIQIDWPNRPRRVIDPAQGKPSQTRWRVLPDGHSGEDPVGHKGRNPEHCTHWTPASAEVTALPTTRLELDPLTGRSHQLRVHLQALGHPILGDPLYAPPAVLSAAGRLLLHASHLAITHPVTGADLHFESPPDF